MKLAEALAERKALSDRITALALRARKSVTVMEGRTPPESVTGLLVQVSQALEQWEQRVVAINRANAHITLSNGETLMEALARRDRLTRELAIWGELMQAATGGPHERMHIMPPGASPMVPAIDLGYLQGEIDRLSQERMTLDLAIQEAGWTHDIQP
jgi:hypothetical protein